MDEKILNKKIKEKTDNVKGRRAPTIKELIDHHCSLQYVQYASSKSSRSIKPITPILIVNFLFKIPRGFQRPIKRLVNSLGFPQKKIFDQIQPLIKAEVGRLKLCAKSYLMCIFLGERYSKDYGEKITLEEFKKFRRWLIKLPSLTIPFDKKSITIFVERLIKKKKKWPSNSNIFKVQRHNELRKIRNNYSPHLILTSLPVWGEITNLFYKDIMKSIDQKRDPTILSKEAETKNILCEILNNLFAGIFPTLDIQPPPFYPKQIRELAYPKVRKK